MEYVEIQDLDTRSQDKIKAFQEKYNKYDKQYSTQLEALEQVREKLDDDLSLLEKERDIFKINLKKEIKQAGFTLVTWNGDKGLILRTDDQVINSNDLPF